MKISSVDIFQEAQRLYDKKGSAFTIQELAESLGVSRVQIFRKVGNKEQILRSLNQSNIEEIDEIDETKKRILMSFRKTMKQYPLASLSMETIAQIAEVSPATLYRLFKNREGLIRALLTQLAQQCQIISSTQEPQNIVEVIEGALLHFRDHIDIIRLGIQERDNPELQDFHEEMEKFRLAVYDHIANFVKKWMTSQEIIEEDPFFVTHVIFSICMMASVETSPVAHLCTQEDSFQLAKRIARFFEKRHHQ